VEKAPAAVRAPSRRAALEQKRATALGTPSSTLSTTRPSGGNGGGWEGRCLGRVVASKYVLFHLL